MAGILDSSRFIYFLSKELKVPVNKIKSFVQSNIWGLFDYGKSHFKKGDIINCYFPIGPNMIS